MPDAPDLTTTAILLARTAEEFTRILTVLAHVTNELEAHNRPVNLHDLNRLEHRLTMKVEEAIAALSELSTVSDSASLRIDTLVTDVDRLIEAFTTGGSIDLTPEQEAAVAKARASRDAAAVTGDKVDAAVARIDAKLPQPAPAGT